MTRPLLNLRLLVENVYGFLLSSFCSLTGDCCNKPTPPHSAVAKAEELLEKISLLELSPDPVIHRLTWFPEGLEQPFNYVALTFGLVVNVQTSAKFLGDIVIVCGVEFRLVGLSSLLPSYNSSAEHHSGSCCSATDW